MPDRKTRSKEELIMALKNLFGWSRKTEAKASSACGSACGAGDKPAAGRPVVVVT